MDFYIHVWRSLWFYFYMIFFGGHDVFVVIYPSSKETVGTVGTVEASGTDWPDVRVHSMTVERPQKGSDAMWNVDAVFSFPPPMLLLFYQFYVFYQKYCRSQNTGDCKIQKFRINSTGCLKTEWRMKHQEYWRITSQPSVPRWVPIGFFFHQSKIHRLIYRPEIPTGKFFTRDFPIDFILHPGSSHQDIQPDFSSKTDPVN